MTPLISVQAAVSPTAQSKRKDILHCVHYCKDAMLGRFYAICNGCSCCCGAMQAHQHGTPMLASSGYVAVVDVDLCAACGTCAEYCQFAAISLDDGFTGIDAAACMGCGVCIAHCPQQTIGLICDPIKGEPLEIQRLIAHGYHSVASRLCEYSAGARVFGRRRTVVRRAGYGAFRLCHNLRLTEKDFGCTM